MSERFGITRVTFGHDNKIMLDTFCNVRSDTILDVMLQVAGTYGIVNPSIEGTEFNTDEGNDGVYDEIMWESCHNGIWYSCWVEIEGVTENDLIAEGIEVFVP